jgi:hypothetical protein
MSSASVNLIFLALEGSILVPCVEILFTIHLLQVTLFTNVDLEAQGRVGKAMAFAHSSISMSVQVSKNMGIKGPPLGN